jgi:glutathione S-transferase
MIDGRQVKTNREIARFLDDLRPEPSLFPAGEEERRAVEEAERWGDEVFQMSARRTALAAALRGPDAIVNRGDDGRLGPLLWRNRTARLAGTRMLALTVFAANRRAEQDLLESLPGHLDRIDGWVEGGVLNGDELNAADFMIAPSLALLCYLRHLHPELEGRPAMRLVDRVLPEPAPAGAVRA